MTDDTPADDTRDTSSGSTGSTGHIADVATAPQPMCGAGGRYHHGDLPAALRGATAALIAEQGPNGFSLREVARRAGVSHAAPAHHFGSAKGLLTAVAREGFEVLEAELAAANASTDDPADRLRAAGVAYVTAALRHPGHYAVMFAEDLHDQGDDGLTVASVGAYTRLLECIENIRDQLNPELDVETAASMTWATMAGLVVLAPNLADVAEKNELTYRPIEELVERFVAFFLHGFVGAP